MSKAGTQHNDLEKLFSEIDDVVNIEDIGKEARLSDAKNTLAAIKADLIGMKRMLVQHPKPEAQFQELGGQPIGASIREKIRQAKRLEDYIAELEKLPDDPPVNETAEGVDAEVNGHKDLPEDKVSDRLDGNEEAEEGDLIDKIQTDY